MAEPILPEGVHIRRTLVRRTSEFLAVAVSPDGRTVAGGAADGCVWLW
ncbi:MAG: WD40 repeat domain-containing protein [Acidobacteriota bacterium]